MNGTTISSQREMPVTPFGQEAVDQWSALCQQFLDWQRTEIFQRDPSPEKLEKHRSSLKWLLRFSRALYLTASDPEYPDRRIADELRGRMVQLEHSWRMIHDKIPDAEAEQFLKEVFPG